MLHSKFSYLPSLTKYYKEEREKQSLFQSICKSSSLYQFGILGLLRFKLCHTSCMERFLGGWFCMFKTNPHTSVV